MMRWPEFTAGLLTACYLLAALFFLKFWRRVRDGLFLTFAVAFALLALQQAAPTMMRIPDDNRAGFYLIRLLAFVMIIVGVLGKNLRRRP